MCSNLSLVLIIQINKNILILSLVQHTHTRAMIVSPTILCAVSLATTVLCAGYAPADVRVYTTNEKMLERHDNGGLNIPHSYKGVVVASIQAYDIPYLERGNLTEELLEGLRAKAANMTANTIVGVRFETIGRNGDDGALMIAYGTAVNI